MCHSFTVYPTCLYHFYGFDMKEMKCVKLWSGISDTGMMMFWVWVFNCLLLSLGLCFISNFRCGVYVVCFPLGYSPASEVVPTYRNILSFHLHRWLGMKCDWSWECGNGLAQRTAWANQEDDGVGQARSQKKAVEGNGPRGSHRYVCEGGKPLDDRVTPVTLHTDSPMKMEQTHCPGMTYKLQTQANNPEQNIQH
jgi:hypothetical protein